MNNPTANSAYLSQIWELESPKIYTILKQESNSSLIKDHPQNNTWRVCVGIWKVMKGQETPKMWIEAPEFAGAASVNLPWSAKTPAQKRQ